MLKCRQVSSWAAPTAPTLELCTQKIELLSASYMCVPLGNGHGRLSLWGLDRIKLQQVACPPPLFCSTHLSAPGHCLGVHRFGLI